MKYHKEQEAKIIAIKQHILEKFEEADKDGIKGDWLKDVVDRFNHPEKYITAKAQGQSFYELGEDYIKKRDLAESHARVFRVLFRAVARYEGFIRATDAAEKISPSTSTKSPVMTLKISPTTSDMRKACLKNIPPSLQSCWKITQWECAKGATSWRNGERTQ